MISPVVEVGDHGADRHAQHHIFAALAVAVAAVAVFAALGAVDAGKAIVDQGVDVAVGHGVDAAAAPAIAAVRSASGDVFFASEAGGAIAAVAGFDLDFCFVNEFHVLSVSYSGRINRGQCAG